MKSNSSLTHILFINEGPANSLAVADLVRQLLVGYPTEKLSWWYSRKSHGPVIHDRPVANSYRFPLHSKLVPHNKMATLKSFVLETFWTRMAAWHLRHTIRTVKPDLVWVLLFGWPILVAAKARVTEMAPTHVSLWDLPDTVNGKRVLGEARCERIMNSIYDLVARAHSCDGISQSISDEITAKTGRTDTVLVHSGFEPGHLAALENASPSLPSQRIRIAYVGTIISEKGFHKLLSALNRVRKQSSLDLCLEFFGGRGYSKTKWFDSTWMCEHPVLSDGKLVETLQNHSWGIVVMDPEEEDIRYSQFSFPNKIGTYLSAGVPVLGFGNNRSPLADVMKNFPVGEFTSRLSEAALDKFILTALQQTKPRSFFHNNILHCAKTEFNAAETRQRLWKVWETSVKK